MNKLPWQPQREAAKNNTVVSKVRLLRPLLLYIPNFSVSSCTFRYKLISINLLADIKITFLVTPPKEKHSYRHVCSVEASVNKRVVWHTVKRYTVALPCMPVCCRNISTLSALHSVNSWVRVRRAATGRHKHCQNHASGDKCFQNCIVLQHDRVEAFIFFIFSADLDCYECYCAKWHNELPNCKWNSLHFYPWLQSAIALLKFHFILTYGPQTSCHKVSQCFQRKYRNSLLTFNKNGHKASECCF